MHQAPFGAGRTRQPRPLVETTPRICIYDLPGVATAPASGLPAREGLGRVLVSIDGGPAVAIDLEHLPQTLGGVQTFFVCNCGRRCHHLYLRAGLLRCRRCWWQACGLDYWSRHTVSPVLTYAAKLRRRLGAAPGLLSPLPPRPRNGSAAARYDRLALELASCEDKIVAMLRDTVRAIKRRKDKP